MWRDDLVHLVWVGGCIKKARRSNCVEICTFCTVIAFLGGPEERMRDWER